MGRFRPQSPRLAWGAGDKYVCRIDGSKDANCERRRSCENGDAGGCTDMPAFWSKGRLISKRNGHRGVHGREGQLPLWDMHLSPLDCHSFNVRECKDLCIAHISSPPLQSSSGPFRIPIFPSGDHLKTTTTLKDDDSLPFNTRPSSDFPFRRRPQHDHDPQ